MTSPQRHLSGQYKEFFEASAHPTVEHWYVAVASPDLRSKMKSVVSKVLAFDLAKATATLRTTHDPKIVKANAIFDKNNGHTIISSRPIAGDASGTTYQQRTVQWLAFASVAEQNAFRETIGLMIPPSRFSSHRQTHEDFDPKRKYWKTENQITDHKTLVCADLLHKPSHAREIECEVIGQHATQTGTHFAWKTAKARGNGSTAAATSAGDNNNGGQGTIITTVSQRAHDSTYRGAPWGVYGTPGDVNANKTQWVSQTKEDFADTFFLQDKSKRRFQNYNDNYIGLLSRHYTDAKREEKERLRGTNASLVASGGVTSTASAVGRGEAHGLPGRASRASSSALGDTNRTLPAIGRR